jgi:hypothetical protein
MPEHVFPCLFSFAKKDCSLEEFFVNMVLYIIKPPVEMHDLH